MFWLLLFPILAYAETSDNIITFENLKLKIVGEPINCPKLSELSRDSEMYWHAAGGWRSYNISFSKELIALVAVQWQGDKVGNIFCQYKDKSQLTFPVALQAPGIYLRPKGDWALAENKSAMNCSAANLYDCSFQKVEELVKTYKKDSDLFDFLEDIKHGEDD